MGAILVALAFIASLFFFIPKQPNPNSVSEIILVPSNLVLNSTRFNQYNSNLSLIAGSPSLQIGLLSRNITSLANLTGALLKSAGINFTMYNGNLCIESGSIFSKDLCDSKNSTWILLVSYNGGSNFTQLNQPLSSIDLNSLYYPQNEFILVYQYINLTQQKLPSL